MATKYTFNIDSPFLQSPQPKPGDRTSSNPFGLSFGGGYSNALTKMNERFNLLISDNLKSLYSFLDDKALDKLNPLNLFKKDTGKSNPLKEKNKFNLGKTLLKEVNTLGKVGVKGGELFGKGMSIVEPLLHKDKTPENKNALLSSDLGNTIANWAPTLGPWGWAYKGLHTLALSTGGMINGSNTGNTLTDVGNGLLGAVVPGAGWLVSKSPEAYRNADVESSAMYYAAPQFAIEHGGGKYLVDRENINKELKRANINTFTISNDIIKPAQLAFRDANDSRHSKRLESELAGGLNTVVNFGVNWAKQGTILQFSKRTLSKLKISKHLIGGKVKETPEIIDRVPEKLSLIPLEEYLQQKRQIWIDKAIQKASTRNAPYMFKNKDWKNCIATAFDSYGLYDKNGIPLVIRNADFVADPNRYGFTELQFGDSIDTLPDGALIQDYNNPKDRSTPGHAIILTGRDENEVPIYSWSSGNNEIEDMHPLARLYSFYWTDKVKPKAYQFIGTPEQIKLWIDEYKQMYHLSNNDIEAFKEGGKVNVIPSGALHAHKHNLTEKAEDGEKFEDVTTKGIPVVVEDEKGNLIQQAEVEREEIIFRLEVTKKLEELSKKHTDEAAIEAGKLLVKEILYNTEDNTGEML